MSKEEPIMSRELAQELVEYHGLDTSKASKLVGLTYPEAAAIVGVWLNEKNNR